MHTVAYHYKHTHKHTYKHNNVYTDIYIQLSIHNKCICWFIYCEYVYTYIYKYNGVHTSAAINILYYLTGEFAFILLYLYLYLYLSLYLYLCLYTYIYILIYMQIKKPDKSRTFQPKPILNMYKKYRLFPFMQMLQVSFSGIRICW